MLRLWNWLPNKCIFKILSSRPGFSMWEAWGPPLLKGIFFLWIDFFQVQRHLRSGSYVSLGEILNTWPDYKYKDVLLSTKSGSYSDPSGRELLTLRRQIDFFNAKISAKISKSKKKSYFHDMFSRRSRPHWVQKNINCVMRVLFLLLIFFSIFISNILDESMCWV
jgi:hypothetical protein